MQVQGKHTLLLAVAFVDGRRNFSSQITPRHKQLYGNALARVQAGKQKSAHQHTLAVTTAIPAGTVAQMPEASKLISGLAACSRWVCAREGRVPGRSIGLQGSMLAGPTIGALVVWGALHVCIMTIRCALSSPRL